MTFKQAKKQLLIVAKGEYCSLSFELSMRLTPEAEDTTNCHLYVNRSKAGDGPTWAEAFVSLEQEMNPKPTLIEEIPNVSDKEASKK